MIDKATKERKIREIMRKTGYPRSKARFVAAIELGEIKGDYTAVSADEAARFRRECAATQGHESEASKPKGKKTQRASHSRNPGP